MNRRPKEIALCQLWIPLAGSLPALSYPIKAKGWAGRNHRVPQVDEERRAADRGHLPEEDVQADAGEEGGAGDHAGLQRAARGDGVRPPPGRDGAVDRIEFLGGK